MTRGTSARPSRRARRCRLRRRSAFGTGAARHRRLRRRARVAPGAAESASGTVRCRTANRSPSTAVRASRPRASASAASWCRRRWPRSRAGAWSRARDRAGAWRERPSSRRLGNCSVRCSTAGIRPLMPASNKASASRHTARCFGPSPERDVLTRQAKRDAAARGVRVEAPARQLREALLAPSSGSRSQASRHGSPVPLENSFRSR